MCSLVAHDRLEPYYEDDVSSIGYRTLPNDATIKTLKSLGATFNFIDICLKLFRGNYCARSESYINAMKEIFMQIPQNVERKLTSKEKTQKLLTDIGGGWYLAKIARGIPPLKRTKLSKNHKKGRIIFKRKCMNQIGGGWYLEKSARGLPPSKRTKLSKKSQERQDYIQKKLYESNRWCNDWRFQLHRNKLECVYPKSTP